jgi:hypothetical protein
MSSSFLHGFGVQAIDPKGNNFSSHIFNTTQSPMTFYLTHHDPTAEWVVQKALK